MSADQCDQELIAAARLGDRAALDAFARRNGSWVRHVIYATLGRASLVDDVCQHVWATVCRQIGTLADPGAWRSWLFRLARNAAIDAGKKYARERQQHRSIGDFDATEDRRNDPVGTLIANEESIRLLEIIHGLPAIYREPFVLKHLQDWSYAEISEAMSIPVDTVETRLVRARRLLRAALSGDGDKPEASS